MATRVADFYKGKTVFITGGTGFLGVCLIEKLLRCCPELKSIYLLIRPKKGKPIAKRLEELTANSVFNRLRQEEQTDLFKKLIPVAGDVGEDNLGLSSNDRLTLVEHVEVVFHSAASLDFEADLKTAININLLGTRRVVQLCQEIRNFKALVHVSSAYVNCVIYDVKEEVYPPSSNVKQVLQDIDNLDSSALKEMTPKILNGHPNAYTFSKQLAEHEIINGKLPATIVRPSMITAAWKEPMPGWTVSKNGPQGFLMGASRGIIRRLPVAKNIIYDYIPVDTVVNNLVVAAYAVDRDGGKEVTIYHCTSSTHNPFRWAELEDTINTYLHTYPLRSAVWYPHIKLLPSILLYKISALFFHMVPAIILDTVTRLSGGRPILVKLHRNVNKSLDRLEKFIFTEWKFHNSQTLALHNSLRGDDKETFNLDIKSMVWLDYFVDLTKGVRQYLSKESTKNLEKARSKDRILMVLHLGLHAVLIGLVWWFVKSAFSTTWTKTAAVVPVTYYLFDQL